jgi:hypothetical protein
MAGGERQYEQRGRNQKSQILMVFGSSMKRNLTVWKCDGAFEPFGLSRLGNASFLKA